MKILITLLYILIFAFITAILYVWGLKHTITQQDDLNRILISKCCKKVIKYLKANRAITESEIAKLIDNTTAGMFWSKNKLKITDGKMFAQSVVSYMLDNKHIVKNGNKYSLNKSIGV